MSPTVAREREDTRYGPLAREGARQCRGIIISSYGAVVAVGWGGRDLEHRSSGRRLLLARSLAHVPHTLSRSLAIFKKFSLQ